MGDAARCYTVDDLLIKLQMAKATFNGLRRAGKMPFLEELRPRLGRRVRFRADLVDQYLRGDWQQPAAFGRRRGA